MRSRRLLVVAPAIAGLAWGALQVWKSDADLVAAEREMAAWRRAGLTSAPATWASVHDALAASVARAPRIAAPAHELLGQLALRRMDNSAAARESFEHFAQAVRLRPVSPYAWASVAEAKYRLGEIDPVFEAALRNAARLGPAEPGVQRVVANYGLAAWSEVSSQTRAAVESLLAAGVRRDPAEMLALAMRRGRLQTACRHLASPSPRIDSRLLQLCRSTEAP
jgi:hypothetical protein